MNETSVRRIPAKRRHVRTAFLIVSFLLFPVTQNYLSPYVIIDGAMQGIVAGSFLSFCALFVASLFLGRSFCSWLCPGGALGELCFAANDRRLNGKRLDPIKYVIWVPWLAAVAGAFIASGGIKKIDPLHLTENVVSVDGPWKYVTYYAVVLLFLIPFLAVGRRAACHIFCWMAPFMIVGRKIRNFLGLPAFELRSDPSRCVSCRSCTQNCPMSLPVDAMVAKGSMENPECILCGMCADTCSGKAITFAFGRGRKGRYAATDDRSPADGGR